MRRILRNVLLISLTLFFSGCGYNTLQMKEEAVFKAWADVESTL